MYTKRCRLCRQLARIDPEFVLCVPYDKLGDHDWWHGQRTAGARNVTVSRAGWLHPALQHSDGSNRSNLRTMLDAVRQPQSQSSSASHQLSNDLEKAVYVDALREMVWSLEDAAQCR